MAQRQTGGRSRALIFLGASAIAAIAAVIGIWQLIRSYQDQLATAEQPVQTTSVVVAAQTLYQGQTLTDKDLVLKDVPPDYVPETVFHSMDEVIGRVPAERIIEGEYVRKERLADPEAGIGLNAIIPRGMRALSINITDGSAVSGFLNPGNYVDVLCTITPPNKGSPGAKPPKAQTITMLQARKVLAVNSRMGEDDPDSTSGYAPSVTLAVTPEEAEKLAHARLQGAVTLTLRNDVDVTQVKVEGVHADKLIGRTDAPAVQVKAVARKSTGPTTPQGGTLEIIKGTTSTHERVDANGNTSLH